MPTVIAWRCEVCGSIMRTFLPAPDGQPSMKTKSFPAICASCGSERFLEVAANQPLVDVKTEAIKGQ